MKGLIKYLWICFGLVALLGLIYRPPYWLLLDLITLFSKINLFFSEITMQFVSYHLVWMPFLFLVVVALLIMLFYPRPTPRVKFFIVILLMCVHTLYIVFRITSTLYFYTPVSTALSLLFLISEVFIYLTSMALYIQIMFVSRRSNLAAKYSKAVLSGKYNPSVDILIPTYSEPIRILKRTIAACQEMDYENKKIYVLDDGRRYDVKRLCEEMGVFYITRENNFGAKSGNINNALKHTDGELIAVFDADTVPGSNFLVRTVGFFQNTATGLVIGLQNFYNLAMFSHNTMAIMEGSRFFHVLQEGRDKFNAVLCFGTGFVCRRTALDDIGGVPMDTISEDWALGIRLQAYGYKTYSLDEVLVSSSIAETRAQFLRQRIRWTQGTIQTLFSENNPWKIKGLSLIQRIIHSYTILHYFINPFYILILIIPIFCFLAGIPIIRLYPGQFFLFFLPYFIFAPFVYSWLTGEYTSKLTDFIGEAYISLHISVAIVKTLLRPYGWRFNVTEKGLSNSIAKFDKNIGIPLLTFLAFNLIAMFYAVEWGYWYDYPPLFVFLFVLVFLRSLFLYIGFYSAYDLPQERLYPRFKRRISGRIKAGEYSTEFTTIDLSEGGMRIKLHLPPGNFICSDAVISLDRDGLNDISVRVKRYNNNEACLEFVDMDLASYRKLVRLLYGDARKTMEFDSLDRLVWRSIKTAFLFRTTLRRKIPTVHMEGCSDGV